MYHIILLLLLFWRRYSIIIIIIVRTERVRRYWYTKTTRRETDTGPTANKIRFAGACTILLLLYIAYLYVLRAYTTCSRRLYFYYLLVFSIPIDSADISYDKTSLLRLYMTYLRSHHQHVYMCHLKTRTQISDVYYSIKHTTICYIQNGSQFELFISSVV